MRHETNERRAALWLLAVCAIYGASFPAMKQGLGGAAAVVGDPAAPWAFLALRFAAATALFPLFFPRVLRQLTPAVLRAGALLALPFAAGYLLQVGGLRHTTPAVSAFLTNLTVVVTPLLGLTAFGERPGLPIVAGALVTAAGVWLLAGPAGGFGLGELLTALGAVAWALRIQLTNGVTRRHPPEAVTFVMFGFTALVSAGVLALSGVGPAALPRLCAAPDVLWPVLFTAVACSIGATTIMNRHQRDLAPSRAAVLYAMEPVCAMVFSTAFQFEPLTPAKLAGGAVIVFGNLACELLRRVPRFSPAK